MRYFGFKILHNLWFHICIYAYVCVYVLDVIDKYCIYVGAFGKVFHGEFTDEVDETVIKVAVKTMKS